MLDICFNLNSEVQTKVLFINIIVKETFKFNGKFRGMIGVLLSNRYK